MSKEFKTYEFASMDENLEQLKDELLESLIGLRLDKNGIFYASTGEHYVLKSWIRDNFYSNIPFLLENPKYYQQTVKTMLDYFTKMEDEHGKISWLIKDPNLEGRNWRFLHPRLTKDLEEINQEWGYIQVDSLGQFLYSIYIGESNGIQIIRHERDREIIQLMIDMLISVDAATLADNGYWEERKAVSMSSQGNLLQGISAMKLLGFNVPQRFLDALHNTINNVLPNEAEDRDVDLAQLSLVYFNIIDPERAREVLRRTEEQLIRKHGCCRYRGDAYYNTANHEEAKRLGRYYDKNNHDYYKGESHWTFGFSFLSLAYFTLGDKEKAYEYAVKMIENTIIHNVELPVIDKETGLVRKDNDGNVVTYVAKSVVPEMFYADTDIPNDNLVLAWSNALAIEVINRVLLGK